MARLYPIVVTKRVTAGQATSQNVKIGVAGDFRVGRIVGAAFLVAALNSAPAGTPLPQRSDTDTAATPVPTCQQVLWGIKTSEDQQSAPLMLATINEFGALMFEPAALPDFPRGSDVTVYVTNNTTVDLDVRIEFHGYYMQ